MADNELTYSLTVSNSHQRVSVIKAEESDALQTNCPYHTNRY